MTNNGLSPDLIEAVRSVAAGGAIAIARGSDGSHHGVAITGASLVMIDPLPRMLLAIRKPASTRPIISATGQVSVCSCVRWTFEANPTKRQGSNSKWRKKWKSDFFTCRCIRRAGRSSIS